MTDLRQFQQVCERCHRRSDLTLNREHDEYWCDGCFDNEIEGSSPVDLTKDEINLLRQWYNAVQDLAPKYLEPKDHELAAKILTALGMKPSAGTPLKRR